MKVIRASQWLDAAGLELCCSVLRQGGVLCYPTETYYGLAIDPSSVKGRERIYHAKGRAMEKELPLIAANREMVEKFCKTEGPFFRVLADTFWPGPLTLVLPSREGSMTLAVRVSSHPLARRISETFGGLITSTSANLSGDPPVADPALLPPAMMKEVDVLIDAGITPGGAPSTIVALSDEGIRVLREGAVSAAEIEQAAKTAKRGRSAS